MGKATVICRDLAPPSEPRRKGFSGVFRKLINLTAVICILSLIAPCFCRDKLVPLETGIARTKTNLSRLGSAKRATADGPITLLNAIASIENAGTGVTNAKSIRMRVTAYCPCPKCCGQYSDGVTACGYKIRPGDTFVAADRRYSFGTEMLVPGYSNGQPVKVLDRGGAIKGNRLDVFFATHQEALEWGVKYLEVSVRWKNL